MGEDVADRGALVRHVASCASCELEVAAWRRWTKMNPTNSHEDEMRVAQDRKSYWRPALAAGILLGLALTLGAQQLLRSPAEPLEAPAPWTGSAALLTLEQPLRGAGPVAQVALEANQPYLPLAVSPTLPEDAAAMDRFRFSIASPTAGTVWSVELTAERVRAQQETTGVVTFLVPTVDLPHGRSGFAMHDAAGASLLEIPFEIQRQSPAATNPPQ
jgi:hypothetical protein